LILPSSTGISAIFPLNVEGDTHGKLENPSDARWGAPS